MSYRSELIQVAAVAIAAVQDLDNGSTTIESKDTHYFDNVVAEVFDERIQQEAKWGARHHDPLKWYAILGEEVGEVARAILEKDIG